MTLLRDEYYRDYWLIGGAPSPGNATNHNHAPVVTGGTTATSGGSNFKRQNTVDAATIKENSARVSSTRSSAPKNSPGQLDTSEFICSHAHYCERSNFFILFKDIYFFFLFFIQCLFSVNFFFC